VELEPESSPSFVVVLVLENLFLLAFISYWESILPGDSICSSNHQIEDDDEKCSLDFPSRPLREAL
jgi:hypothetical protein